MSSKFTVGDVHKVLKYLAGFRISQVEFSEGGKSSSIVLKTYDGPQVYVGGARFSIAPWMRGLENLVIESVSLISDDKIDTISIKAFGVDKDFEITFYHDESKIYDVDVKNSNECSLLFSSHDKDIKRIAESLAGSVVNSVSHNESSVKVDLTDYLGKSKMLTISDNKSVTDDRNDIWVSYYKLFKSAQVHDVRIVNQDSRYNSFFGNTSARIVLEAIDDNGAPVMEFYVMVDTHEEERPDLFVKMI
mgnify:CR=1 FL=1|jgi:hypothetical protein